MKIKYYLTSVALMAAFGLTTAACSDENDDKENDTEINGGGNSDNNNDSETPNQTIKEIFGEIEGSLTAGRYFVSNHLVIPQGKSLILEPGVELIFTTKGVGSNHVPVEFSVKGNLYSMGTAEKPVLMTIPEEERTAENIFQEDHQWGGIMAYKTCNEMLIDHTVIEYTGGQVIEGSPAAAAGEYVAGDDAYPHITTTNPDGRYVITNSTIRYGWSDGIYMMGGKAIIAHNTFAANGFDGAEAVNIKAGCQVDVAGNIMYAPNTNGLKLSSGGQGENGKTQGKIKAYNNTILNSGWRRDGEKGGCIYAEKNVLADVFNNMLINCKYRAQTAGWKDPNNIDEGYDTHSTIDYNCYVSGNQKSDVIWAGEENDEGKWEAGSGIAFAWEGYNTKHKNYHLEDKTLEDGTVVPAIDAHSVIATEQNLPNPGFVNYDINTAKMSLVAYNEAWDFHVQHVIPGAYNGNDAFAQPYYLNDGLNVNGQTFKSPAVQPFFGAYGTK